MTARDPSKLEVHSATDNVFVQKLDVTHPDQVAAAIKATEAHFGGNDVLVTKAGIGNLSAIEESEYPEVRKMFEVSASV